MSFQSVIGFPSCIYILRATMLYFWCNSDNRHKIVPCGLKLIQGHQLLSFSDKHMTNSKTSNSVHSNLVTHGGQQRWQKSSVKGHSKAEINMRFSRLGNTKIGYGSPAWRKEHFHFLSDSFPRPEESSPILAMFGSNHNCKATFSTMNIIKTNPCSRLNNEHLHMCMRIAPTQIKPRFKILAGFV